MRNTIKFENQRVKMIAHRGLSKLELENTKEAMIAACNRSYFGIETDVRLTKDNKLVLFHDDDLKRLANLEKKVIDMTYVELCDLELDNQINYLVTKNRVMLYEDYLCILKEYNKVPIIEIKGEHTNESLQEILALGLKYFFPNQLVFIGFNVEYLKYLKQLNSDLIIQLLFGKNFEENVRHCIENKFDVDIHYDLLTKENVEILRKNNMKINVWTVDNLDWAEKNADNLDFITTNILE